MCTSPVLPHGIHQAVGDVLYGKNATVLLLHLQKFEMKMIPLI